MQRVSVQFDMGLNSGGRLCVLGAQTVLGIVYLFASLPNIQKMVSKNEKFAQSFHLLRPHFKAANLLEM